jgi:hypothetical protein
MRFYILVVVFPEFVSSMTDPKGLLLAEIMANKKSPLN